MPTPFDWTPIFGIEFRFASASNPTAATSLNKTYSEIIGKDELSEFFVTREGKEAEGPLEIAPDPQLHILNYVAKAIAINLIDPDKVTKGHISNLLHKCVIKHVRHNGSRKRMRSRTEFDAAAKHAIRTNTDEESIPTPETHHLPPHPGPNLPIYYSENIPHQRPLPRTLTPAEQAKNVNATIPSDTTKIVDSNAAATPVEALSETPATFRRTFNPHSQSVAFHHLPTPVPLPKSPGASSLKPIWSKVSHTGSHVILPHTNPTVLRITKRHRDALKIKLFHLHANILSMNWFYDTIG
eukprot:jgi/Psemu1/34213/gm1.34213_g